MDLSRFAGCKSAACTVKSLKGLCGSSSWGPLWGLLCRLTFAEAVSGAPRNRLGALLRTPWVVLGASCTVLHCPSPVYPLCGLLGGPRLGPPVR
eukprot:2536099-Pyramimonas_sp.AAC.1